MVNTWTVLDTNLLYHSEFVICRSGWSHATVKLWKRILTPKWNDIAAVSYHLHKRVDVDTLVSQELCG